MPIGYGGASDGLSALCHLEQQPVAALQLDLAGPLGGELPVDVEAPVVLLCRLVVTKDPGDEVLAVARIPLALPVAVRGDVQRPLSAVRRALPGWSTAPGDRTGPALHRLGRQQLLGLSLDRDRYLRTGHGVRRRRRGDLRRGESHRHAERCRCGPEHLLLLHEPPLSPRVVSALRSEVVSWLSGLTAMPSQRLAGASGFDIAVLPDYSGGSAPDSHRLPITTDLGRFDPIQDRPPTLAAELDSGPW